MTDTRTRGDWAHVIRDRVEGRRRDADKVVLVMDQLNTHSPASLYEAFPPEEAQRIAARLEVHHMPKHGSWLNRAEIELSAFARDLPKRGGGSSRAAATRGAVDGAPQCRGCECRLAVHHRRCENEAPQTLPDHRRVTVN